jgi:hypothetical protein
MLRLQGVSSPDSASRKSTMSIYSLLDPCPRASVPTTARATSPRMSSSNVICSPWPSTTHCLRPNKASPPPSSQALDPRRACPTRDPTTPLPRQMLRPLRTDLTSSVPVGDPPRPDSLRAPETLMSPSPPSPSLSPLSSFSVATVPLCHTRI